METGDLEDRSRESQKETGGRPEQGFWPSVVTGMWVSDWPCVFVKQTWFSLSKVIFLT